MKFTLVIKTFKDVPFCSQSDEEQICIDSLGTKILFASHNFDMMS